MFSYGNSTWSLLFFPTSIRVEIACLVSAFTAFLIFIDFESNCLTFNFVSASGEENVRVAVGSTDEPPLDETDTITTTFGFNHG